MAPGFRCCGAFVRTLHFVPRSLSRASHPCAHGCFRASVRPFRCCPALSRWGKGPAPGDIDQQGAAYLKQSFPRLSYIRHCKLLAETEL
jgi:hypothetical protein